MKTYAFLIILSVFLLQPCLASSGESPDDVIGNINGQLAASVAAGVVMKIKKGDRVLETKGFDLFMKVEEGKESLKGKILQPVSRRGRFTVRWEGGRALIKYVETGYGRERRVSTSLGSPFLGSSAAWIDVRVLEDSENYEYRWKERGVIEATSKKPELTVYGKRVLLVEEKDGLWVIKHVKCYSKRGRLIRTRKNRDFVQVGHGWRPGRIVVEKGAYTTVLRFDWKSETVFD